MTDHARMFVDTLGRLARPIPADASILDFGCGKGDMVYGLRNLGYDAFGCDIALESGPHTDELRECARLRPIADDPYRLPFPDQAFDFVVSDQVFEHVMDYDAALAEIARVLKPAGACLHVFPARYVPVEPHLYVPAASFLAAPWWLRLWARMGVRNEYQQGDPPEVVVAKNAGYLRERTNYLPRGEIRSAFARHFADVRFSERAYLQRDNGHPTIRGLAASVPCLPRLYSSVRSRVVFAALPVTTIDST